MNKTYKFILYAVEIIIAAIILHFSLQFFLLYFFVSFIWKIEQATDYLRKLIRIFQIINDARFLAMMDKLGVKEEELNDKLEDMKGNMTHQQWQEIEKEFKELSGIRYK
jgi:hypothetical protein